MHNLGKDQEVDYSAEQKEARDYWMEAFLIAWDDLTAVGDLGIYICKVEHFARSVGSFRSNL